jgi:hypothetical protein
MKNNMDMKEYSTTNFQIAAWLMLNDIPLKDVQWKRRRAEFVFEDFEGREEMTAKFFQEEQLQKWISTTQELKARMYADQPPIEYDRE